MSAKLSQLRKLKTEASKRANQGAKVESMTSNKYKKETSVKAIKVNSQINIQPHVIYFTSSFHFSFLNHVIMKNSGGSAENGMGLSDEV